MVLRVSSTAHVFFFVLFREKMKNKNFSCFLSCRRPDSSLKYQRGGFIIFNTVSLTNRYIIIIWFFPGIFFLSSVLIFLRFCSHDYFEFITRLVITMIDNFRRFRRRRLQTSVDDSVFGRRVTVERRFVVLSVDGDVARRLACEDVKTRVVAWKTTV